MIVNADRHRKLKRYTVLTSTGHDYSGAVIGATDHHDAALVIAFGYEAPVTLTVRAYANGEGERHYQWQPRDETLTRLEHAGTGGA